MQSENSKKYIAPQTSIFSLSGTGYLMQGVLAPSDSHGY